CLSWLKSHATKVFAVAACARGRRPEARQDVLLDDDPAGVVLDAQRVQHAHKRHHSLPELAEDAAAHRRVIVPPFGSRTARELRLAILEVNMPDAIAILRDGIDRVAAGVHQMPGVAAEADHLGIGPRHQRLDLPRRLDPAGAVMMEDGADAGAVANRGCHTARAFRVTVPLLGAQAVLVTDAPGASRSVRDRRV